MLAACQPSSPSYTGGLLQGKSSEGRRAAGSSGIELESDSTYQAEPQAILRPRVRTGANNLQPQENLPTPPTAATFANPHDVIIEGPGTFTSAGKNVYHIRPTLTVNLAADHDPSRSPSPPTPIAPGPTPSPAALFPSPAPSAPASALIRQTSTPENDSEIYARLLLPKKLGWPLWLPRPGSHPQAYATEGVLIGDVGIVTADGRWDYLWNITREAADERNSGGVPVDFKPVGWREGGGRREEEIWTDEDYWKVGDCISNGSITEPDIQATPLGPSISLSFSCTPTEGAVLVLPLGGSRSDLLSTTDFEAYASLNAESWYGHVNTPVLSGGRGRGARNGELYLVTGVDKATAWGTASFSGVNGEGSFGMRFGDSGVSRDRTSRKYAYEWTRSGLAATKHGPPLSAHQEALPPTESQCTFLRGFRVAVAESVWAQIFRPIEVQSIVDAEPASLLTKSSYVPFGSSGMVGLSSFLGLLRRTVSRSNRERKEPGIVTPDFPILTEGLHPSDTINAYLLERDTSARVAITHDRIWFDVVENGAEKLPTSHDLISRLEERYEVVKQGAVVKFDLKESTRLALTPRGESSMTMGAGGDVMMEANAPAIAHPGCSPPLAGTPSLPSLAPNNFSFSMRQPQLSQPRKLAVIEEEEEEGEGEIGGESEENSQTAFSQSDHEILGCDDARENGNNTSPPCPGTPAPALDQHWHGPRPSNQHNHSSPRGADDSVPFLPDPLPQISNHAGGSPCLSPSSQESTQRLEEESEEDEAGTEIATLVGDTSTIFSDSDTLYQAGSLRPISIEAKQLLFPENQQVEDWYHTLQIIGHDSNCLQTRDATFIKRLYFCKGNKSIQHEHIVADIVTPDGIIVHGIIDRSDSTGNMHIKQSGVRKKQTTPAGSLTPLTLLKILKKPSHNNDRVRFYAGQHLPTANSIIKYLDFDLAGKTGPSLVQLAIAAVAAHRYDAYYSLFRHQCYWYADYISAMIEEIAGEGNFAVLDKTGQSGRQRDEVTLRTDQLEEIRASLPNDVANGEVFDIVDSGKESRHQLQPGTNTLRISTRGPKAVRWMKLCLDKVTEEWNEQGGERFKLEMEAQNTGREAAERKLEELNERLQELERTLAAQQS